MSSKGCLGPSRLTRPSAATAAPVHGVTDAGVAATATRRGMGGILEGCSPHLELETARCRGPEISMVPTWLAPARCIQVLPIRHPLRRLCLKMASGRQRYEMKVEIIIGTILRTEERRGGKK